MKIQRLPHARGGGRHIIGWCSATAGGFELKSCVTRKRIFLAEMQQVVPWNEFGAIIAPYAKQADPKGGRPPFAVSVMLRIHFLLQWFGLSDPAMEEALYDVPLYREFVTQTGFMG